MSSEHILLVAGEASGDLHAARMLTELKKLSPEVVAFGLGGNELQSAGLDLIAHSSEISVIGITEVLQVLGRARRIFASLLQEVDQRQARTAILIDFPDFNLRLAKALKKRGVRVVYYISPQVWAWRQGRVRTIAEVVDQMLVLLPFEVDFYARHGIEATYVGHPLVDEVPQLASVWDQEVGATDSFHLSLLPGSRRSEVGVLLPIMLRTAEALSRRHSVRFSLIRATGLPAGEIDEIVQKSSADIDIVARHRFETIASSHLALCAAGTATLEVGLLGTPMIVTHKVSLGSYALGRLLVRLPYTSLVNLLLQREAVPEILQWEATPSNLAHEASQLLCDASKVQAMRRNLAQLRESLQPAGASRRAAEIIASHLTDRH